ncbi:MAG: hypothetical protein GC154_05955 [bacterium]|nr:hypothetical protein [bacterium]
MKIKYYFLSVLSLIFVQFSTHASQITTIEEIRRSLEPLEICFQGTRLDNYSMDSNNIELHSRYLEYAIKNSSSIITPQQVEDWYKEIQKSGRKYAIDYITAFDGKKASFLLITPPGTKMPQEMIREEIVNQNNSFLSIANLERIHLWDSESFEVAKQDVYDHNFNLVDFAYPFSKSDLTQLHEENSNNEISLLSLSDNTPTRSNNTIISLYSMAYRCSVKTIIFQKNNLNFADHVWYFEGSDYRKVGEFYLPFKISVLKLYQIKNDIDQTKINSRCPMLTDKFQWDIYKINANILEPLCMYKWDVQIQTIETNKSFSNEQFWPRVPSSWSFRDARSHYDQTNLILQKEDLRGVGPHEFPR